MQCITEQHLATGLTSNPATAFFAAIAHLQRQPLVDVTVLYKHNFLASTQENILLHPTVKTSEG